MVSILLGVEFILLGSGPHPNTELQGRGSVVKPSESFI